MLDVKLLRTDFEGVKAALAKRQEENFSVRLKN